MIDEGVWAPDPLVSYSLLLHPRMTKTPGFIRLLDHTMPTPATFYKHR